MFQPLQSSGLSSDENRPVFGCRSGAGAFVAPTTVNDNREPRFVADGRDIVTVHSGRRQTPPRARDDLLLMIEGILATRQDDLVDSDILRAGDLIRAIRAAERNDPTPPARIARAAA